MRRIKLSYFTAAIIAILAFFSCEKELEYELEFEGQRLVVYGFINPTDTVKIRVSKTLPVFEDREGSLFVSDAEVLLYEDKVLVEKLDHKREGLFFSTSGFKPSLGKAYHVEVTAPNLPAVKSSAQSIPTPQPISDLEFVDSIRSASQASGETLTFLFNLGFDDLEAEENYYAINILGKTKVGDIDDIFSFTVDDVYDQGAGAQCDFFFNSELEYRIGLSDYCFEGGGQKIPLVVGVYSSQSGQSFKAIRVDFYSLSDALFQFNKTLSTYRNNEIEPLEPAIIESNIQGGYGVFGAYFKDHVWFDF